MNSILKKKVKGNGESGFTLIELLVVVIIIAILAAIAIPMYLSQREKGYRATTQSDLRNAAVAAESYYTDDGTYVGLDLAALEDNGFNPSADVTTAVVDDEAEEYCITAVHDNLGEDWMIGNRDGDIGAPEEGDCT